MATLDQLKKSISMMEPSELIEHFRRLRASRRTVKLHARKVVKQRTATAQKENAKTVRTTRSKEERQAKTLTQLSPAMAAELLKQLGGSDND